MVLDLFPVGVEIAGEFGAVVGIVARVASRVGGLFECQPHLFLQLFLLGFGHVHIAIFGCHVSRSGTVAIFAAVTMKLLLGYGQVARNERQIFLGLPARHMAAQAFRIEMPRRVPAAVRRLDQ